MLQTGIYHSPFVLLYKSQLCHVLLGPQFRMGKWPWKHPAESLATPLKLKENLQRSCQRESNNPWASTSYYSWFFNQLVPGLRHLDSYRTHKAPVVQSLLSNSVSGCLNKVAGPCTEANKKHSLTVFCYEGCEGIVISTC